MLTLGALFLPDTPNSLLDRGFASDAEVRPPGVLLQHAPRWKDASPRSGF